MIETQEIFIPEEHFRDVPESFSTESQITGVESRVNTNGIILDNLKEVEHVLRIHNDERTVMPLSSLATTMGLVKDIHADAGPMGAGLVLLAGDTMLKGRDFVGTMMAEAKGNLATKGEYRRSYDYDAMGSNFLKTSVNIRRVEDKFVLNIGAAYVGNKSEAELAVLLGRPIALSSVNIDISMSVVDDWWYNLSLPKVLGDIGYFDPNFEPTWQQLSQVLADEDRNF
jgi:hypothetical protein